MTETITSIGEKQLIKILLEKRDKQLQNNPQYINNSYHDDAALIKNTTKHTVVSTDMLLEHSHFPKNMTYYQMGQKIVTVNVSDILSMNATPDSILISMGLPSNMSLNNYNILCDGILDKCREYNIRLIGGDLNQADEIILTGTCIGKIDDNYTLQYGIQEGNLIAVSGCLGTPAAAYDLLYNHDCNIEDKDLIINSLLEPEIPIKLSEKLKNTSKLITSMTDITDGLAVELGHLQDKNPEIGFEIYYDKIPYLKQIKKVAKHNNKNLKDYLLHFGEEFELLFTLNKKEYEKITLNELHIIGKTNNSGKITLIRGKNKEIIEIKGYEHLSD